MLSAARLLSKVSVAACLLLASRGLAADRPEALEEAVDALEPLNSLSSRRLVKLNNKLNVLLIHNPGRTRATAALNVGVGALADPVATPGFSHLLEHLVLAGGRRAQEGDSFARFVEANQGDCNAYTLLENTNYYFSIKHDALREALKRFAQLFTDPDFDPTYLSKEAKAVNDEAASNLDFDDWRRRLLYRRLMRSEHPLSRYHIGNTQTLEQVTAEQAKAYFVERYSAADMDLVVDSRFSLDEMEGWVREGFDRLADRGEKRQTYEQEVFTSKQLPLKVYYRSINKSRQLDLHFPLPPLQEYWRSKPGYTIAHIVGHEGQGSLLSLLKRHNLATSLVANFDDTSFNSSFDIEIALTPQGLGQTAVVIEMVFSFLRLFESQGLRRSQYDELKDMAETSYLYSNANHPGSALASAHTAEAMRLYPALQVNQRRKLFYKFLPADVKRVLTQLRPERMLAMVSAPDTASLELEADFKIPYRREGPSRAEMTAWREPREFVGLRLPRPNPYVPSESKMTPGHGGEAELVQALAPAWGSFWLGVDQKLGLPTARLRLSVLSPILAKPTPQNMALTYLYVQALNRQLAEWTYELAQAGVGFRLLGTSQGLEASMAGFSEKMPQILAELGSKLTRLSISREELEGLKAAYRDHCADALRDNAWDQIPARLSAALNPSSLDECVAYVDFGDEGVDAIGPVNLAGLGAFGRALFKRLSVEGLAVGQLQPQPMRAALQQFLASLGSSPVPREALPPHRAKLLPEGEAQRLTLIREVSNHGWGEVVQFGERTAPLEAKLLIAEAYFGPHFFEHIRTREGLGYAVFHGDFTILNRGALVWLVESSSHRPGEIEAKVRLWQEQALADFIQLPESEYEDLRQGVALKARQEAVATTMDAQFHRLDAGLYIHGRADYGQALAAAVASTTREEVADLLKQTLIAKLGGKFTIALFGQGQPPPPPPVFSREGPQHYLPRILSE